MQRMKNAAKQKSEQYRQIGERSVNHKIYETVARISKVALVTLTDHVAYCIILFFKLPGLQPAISFGHYK